MWKQSKLFNCKWLFMQIIALSISLNEAVRCTDCSPTILESESKNITYGPGNEYNCNCDWTIPTSIETDHETAVVLLLQNVSLPMTTGTGSIECSAEIRFPNAGYHKCDFSSIYCLAFATASTICNINKIREKILVANYTCDSIIPWNKAGGSPYKISYYAKNFRGYTKHFRIQYLVINCRPTTTSLLTTVPERATTHSEETSSYQMLYSDLATERIKTLDNTQNTTYEIECTSSQASLIIAIPVSGIMGLIIGALLMFIIPRYCNNHNKKPRNKDSMEIGRIQHPHPTVDERTTYENYTPTSDENGYEVPIQVDNKNEQQYEVVRSGREYQYENA
uniref:uncharacterized protein LOC120347532 n=1 Tax=Styela clava TaxID=7725 RepID=UPI001939811E|nr:uncharacterized protein LOC120347532 [Styela clava]